jgi:hypothetical protein
MHRWPRVALASILVNPASLWWQMATAEGCRMDENKKSLVWRCSACGRLCLSLEPVDSPSWCGDCGGTAFHAAGPFSDPRGQFRAAFASGLAWPLVERRKGPRL